MTTYANWPPPPKRDEVEGIVMPGGRMIPMPAYMERPYYDWTEEERKQYEALQLNPVAGIF